ncbi:MAG: hypothetical protein U0354_10615 [Candidatus Sericytochromatia bacterium]
MLKRLFFIFFTLLILLHKPETSYAEVTTIEQEVKTKLQRINNLDFSEKDVLILKDIPLNKSIIVKGYSKKENEKLSIKAAQTDLLKNYVSFIKGWNYELKDNKLKLIFDDNIKLKDIDVKSLTNEVYEASRLLELSETYVKEYSKQESIFVFSKAEIKDNILSAFSEARTKAIVKALNEFYLNKRKDNVKGKIFFQDIIYNSLDEYNPFQTEVIYVVRFSISDY